jgi:hypothetical protein
VAWHTGTSTNHLDLLADIRTHVLAGNWAEDLYDTSVIDANNDEWIAHATNVSGNDTPYIGIRTYHDATSGAYGFELAGGTGYNSGGSGWETFIVAISPGRFNGSSDDLKYGAYVPLVNSSMPYWLSVTDRRIAGVVKANTGYFSFYLGLLDTFAVSTSYPFPMYVAGCSPFFNTLATDNEPAKGSGLADPIGFNVATAVKNGPAFLRFTDGQWYTIRNSFQTGTTTRTASQDRVVYPAGTVDLTALADPADQWFSTNQGRWSDLIPNSGNPGTEVSRLHKTPGTVDKSPIWPATVLFQTPSEQFQGEMAGVAWVSGADGVGAEDDLDDGTDTWRVFQNGVKTDIWHRFAVKEA